jgi:hypothetical protein
MRLSFELSPTTMVTTRSTTNFNQEVARRISDPVDRSLCYAGSDTTQLLIEWDYRATSPDSQATLPIDPQDVFHDLNDYRATSPDSQATLPMDP